MALFGPLLETLGNAGQDEKPDIKALVSKTLKSERGAWMIDLTSSMNSMFVKDASWSKFLIQIRAYIKQERSDKITYHNIIASPATRLTSLENGSAAVAPSQHHDPFATTPTPQAAPTDVTALLARVESLVRSVKILKDHEGKEKSV